MRTISSVSFTAALVLFAAACSGGDATAPVPELRIAIAEGDRQAALVGSNVTVAPRVRVTTAAGAPRPGVSVTFAPSAGGGVGAERATTDEQGYAWSGRWTLGTVAGPQSLRATIGSQWVQFTATALTGLPRMLTPLSADDAIEAGLVIPEGPGVRVTDEFGNPVGNVRVVFRLSTPEGVAGQPVDGYTDSSGVARVTALLLASTGRYTLTAAIPAASASITITSLAGSGCYHRLLTVASRIDATLTADDCPDVGTARYDDFALTLGTQTDFTVAVGGSVPLALQLYVAGTMLGSYARPAGVETPAPRFILPAGTYGFRARGTTYGGYALSTMRSAPRRNACGERPVLMPGVTLIDSVTTAGCVSPYNTTGYRDVKYRIHNLGRPIRVRIDGIASETPLDYSFARTDAAGRSSAYWFLGGESWPAGAGIQYDFPGSGSAGEYYDVTVTGREDRARPFTMTITAL